LVLVLFNGLISQSPIFQVLAWVGEHSPLGVSCHRLPRSTRPWQPPRMPH
jgi:hypothetical protein